MLCPISNQRPEEEKLNRLTHGAGVLLSLLGLVMLLVLGLQGGLFKLAVGLVYGLSLLQLFVVSTLYHSSKEHEFKRKMRVLDHCSIYLLIAGSYTPFMLLALGGWRGWTMVAAVWALAVYGVRFKFTSSRPFGVRSVLLYLFMGWLVMLVYKPLMLCMTPAAGSWLVAGGVAYTVGVIFYAWQRLYQSHAVWHVFVLGGALCHFVAAVSLF